MTGLAYARHPAHSISNQFVPNENSNFTGSGRKVNCQEDVNKKRLVFKISPGPGSLGP